MLKKRLVLLEDTLTFLNTLIVSIEFTRADMLRIISDMINEGTVKNLSFLRACADEIIEGYDFSYSWCNAVESFRLYKSDEKAKLLQLGAVLGTSDSKNQIKIIKTYIYFFEGFLLRANNDFAKYGKVSLMFGMFSGAAVFVLLL